MGAWFLNDLTQTGGSDPTGFVAIFQNTEHVIFVDEVSHIQELFYPDPSGRWGQSDLTINWGAPLGTGVPSGLTQTAYYGYTPFADSKKFVYRGQSTSGDDLLRLYLMQFGEMTNQWTHVDILAQTSGTQPPEPLGNKPSVFVWPSRRTLHVVYLGTDTQIHELFSSDGGQTWQHTDFATLGAPAAQIGSNPVGFIWHAPPFGYGGFGNAADEDSEHIFYVDTQGLIQELWFDGVNWHLRSPDPTTASGGPVAGGNPTAYAYNPPGDTENTMHVIYRDLDSDHIHELFLNGYDDQPSWQHNDLTAIAANGPALPINGDPSGYVFWVEGTQHVAYRGIDNKVHELYFGWDVNTGTNQWQYNDMSSVPGLPEAVSDPVGYTWEAQPSQHIVFRGLDEQQNTYIYELYSLE